MPLFRVCSKFISPAETQGSLSSTVPFEIQNCKKNQTIGNLKLQKIPTHPNASGNEEMWEISDSVKIGTKPRPHFEENAHSHKKTNCRAGLQ